MGVTVKVRHIQTDVKIHSYWMRLPYKRRVEEEFVFRSYKRALEEAHKILAQGYYDFAKIYHVIVSESGYTVYGLKVKIYR